MELWGDLVGLPESGLWSVILRQLGLLYQVLRLSFSFQSLLAPVSLSDTTYKCLGIIRHYS